MLYTVGKRVLLAAAEDVAAAADEGALPVGEEHGLPLIRFPLEAAADAHAAVQNNAVGKVILDVTAAGQ
ncbi:hypothetical protein [Paractinoplanes brasiliensis]|uniref:hypothetical protein n=1 Tax=Paractinoplanes brasiliensis TaxID=52695 RepID=UPI0019455633|nr:hypothetical protein [Actinoplanes brasiliensis]GID27526.1 hypothetical protein Abr02nite_25090 [Actinoplanes brasiliensis]